MAEHTGTLTVNEATSFPDVAGELWEQPPDSNIWHVRVPTDGFPPGAVTSADGKFSGSWGPITPPAPNPKTPSPIPFTDSDAETHSDGSLKWFRMEMILGEP